MKLIVNLLAITICESSILFFVVSALHALESEEVSKQNICIYLTSRLYTHYIQAAIFGETNRVTNQRG